MTSRIRTSCWLALAITLAACTTPTTVPRGAEPAHQAPIAAPPPAPVTVPGPATALPAPERIVPRGGAIPDQQAARPDTTADRAAPAKSELGSGVCRGKDPAAEARATQGISAANPTNPYVGKDTYANVVVTTGAIFFSLTPGSPPGFAVTRRTLARARGNLIKYYDLVQVTTDPGTDATGAPRQLRNAVRLFRVRQDLCVARGQARANPQFGRGGATQYYVSPSDRDKLSPGKIWRIDQGFASMQSLPR